MSGTNLIIKRDLFPEITEFSQINQVRIVPSIKNDKNKKLSDLLEEYEKISNAATPLFTIEIVYTVPISEKGKITIVYNYYIELILFTKSIRKLTRLLLLKKKN